LADSLAGSGGRKVMESNISSLFENISCSVKSKYTWINDSWPYWVVTDAL